MTQVLRQIASAMACLHHADIQHRDLKPDNVFFGFDGDIRIADFGARLNHFVALLSMFATLD